MNLNFGVIVLSLIHIRKYLFFEALINMSQDKKRDAIIEAALKRFAHFGVAKTTMTEIGNDLSLSKASLYYYFPDKLSLYAAVLKHISEATEKKDEAIITSKEIPLEAIHTYLDIRTDFIIKYHNILEYLKTYTPLTMPPELQELFSYFYSRELSRITAIIEKGKQQSVFHISDSRKTAELFFDFLEGFRYSFITRSGNFFPDKKQFLTILKKEKEFASIFFKGLS
ncbi:TetR/AcrR family transcriptional regulator [Flavisolibacter tropicus]|nr:TetR/AcrR family transcriptional regulator [Flavisolibacter tropicus]